VIEASRAAQLVAIVNNDAAFVRLLETLLHAEGYATLLQQIGDIAYESIKQQQPRVVILDIGNEIPHESWRVVDLLRLDPATAAMPVIICAVVDQALRERLPKLQSAGYAVLEKPFALAELLDKVRTFLSPPTV
jgi:DNA-binding response OmpR family regulator